MFRFKFKLIQRVFCGKGLDKFKGFIFIIYLILLFFFFFYRFNENWKQVKKLLWLFGPLNIQDMWTEDRCVGSLFKKKEINLLLFVQILIRKFIASIQFQSIDLFRLQRWCNVDFNRSTWTINFEHMHNDRIQRSNSADCLSFENYASTPNREISWLVIGL